MASFSRVDKLRLAFRFCRAPWQVLAYVVRSVAIASARQLPLRLYAVCAVAKALQDVFDARDTQYLCRSTNQVYKDWVCRKTLQADKGESPHVAGRLSCDIEPLEESNSSILWVGDRRKAKRVVLFFHGGGYTTPMLDGYMECVWRAFIMAGIETQTEVAVAILEYSLAPVARYPTQLCQAASGLAHLLSSGIPAKNIILGGDSAGGNLTGQLLCHMAWPHPAAVPIRVAEPLAGVFLVSPWLTKHTNDKSFAENGSIDMLSASFVNIVTAELFGFDDWAERSIDCTSHAFPLDMELPWMDKLNSLTNQVYLSVGYHEVLRDQCIEFVELIRTHNPGFKVQFDLQGKLAHDFILIEGEEKRNGECIEAMKEWIKSILV